LLFLDLVVNDTNGNFALNIIHILFDYCLYEAQRLAAQPPGRFRYPVTILTGILKPQFGIFSLSLGQVGCSRVLGRNIFFSI
jgi:hypothetical protein